MAGRLPTSRIRLWVNSLGRALTGVEIVFAFWACTLYQKGCTIWISIHLRVHESDIDMCYHLVKASDQMLVVLHRFCSRVLISMSTLPVIYPEDDF